MRPAVHPIEAESYEILRARIDLGHLDPGVRAVVERVIHASADLDYAASLVLDASAVEAGVAALAAGAVVVCDAEMVRVGVTRALAVCLLPDVPAAGPGGFPTRSALAMELAATRYGDGAVVCVGNAPTALAAALDLVDAGRWHPALIVGLPVGFVGAAEAKARARAAGVPAITNVGEKGGSAVAAAAVNALWRLVEDRRG